MWNLEKSMVVVIGIEHKLSQPKGRARALDLGAHWQGLPVPCGPGVVHSQHLEHHVLGFISKL